MDRLLFELRLALRRLMNRPGFTLTAVLSLAFGIGANTVFFSLLNSTLLKPLPVDRPHELFSTVEPKFTAPVVSYPNFVDIRDRAEFASGVIGYRVIPVAASFGPGRNSRMWGYLTSGNYFEVLGVKAALGRVLTPDDTRSRGANAVAVLSYQGWKQRFGSDPAIIGKSVKVNGLAYSIIGVTPADFYGTERFFAPEVFLPDAMVGQLEPGTKYLDDRESQNTFVLVRLKAGVSKPQAQASLDALIAQLGREYPEENSGMRLRLVEPGWGGDFLRGNVIAFNSMLMAIAGALLLVVCVNLASLLLAQVSERKKETAIRLAIGASRGQLLRQLLFESVLLAATGGAVGVLAASWGVDAISSYSPPVDFSIYKAVSIDWRVAAFSALVTLAASLLFGLMPAWQSTRTDLVAALKSDSSNARSRQWPLRDLLVAGQIVVSVVLLACSGLMLRSLRNSMSLDLGFNPHGAAALGFDLASQGYSEEMGVEFQRELLRQARTAPGIRLAAMANALPLDFTSISNNGVFEHGQPQPPMSEMPLAQAFYASDGFFRTLETQVIAGREFAERDTPGRPVVMVVNREFTRRILKLSRPELAVGKRVVSLGKVQEIVGVTEDGKYLGLTEAPKPVMFYSARQNYSPETRLVWRTNGDPAETVARMRQLALDMNPELAIHVAGTLDEHMLLPTLPTKFAATTMSAFGLITMLLAAVGIYGVTAFAMSRRTREIGIRMAIGATPGSIVQMIMGRAGRLIGLAAVIGGIASLLAGGLLAPMLIGVNPRDWMSHGAGVLSMVLIALLACWIPARKAWRMDPSNALRRD